MKKSDEIVKIRLMIHNCYIGDRKIRIVQLFFSSANHADTIEKSVHTRTIEYLQSAYCRCGIALKRERNMPVVEPRRDEQLSYVTELGAIQGLPGL